MTTPTFTRPVPAVLVRKRVREYLEMNPAPISEGAKGAIVRWLNQIAGGDENRYLVLGWLFAAPYSLSRPMHRKDVPESGWVAMQKWINATEVQGEWLPDPAFRTEALWILKIAQSEQRPGAIPFESTILPPDMAVTGVSVIETKPEAKPLPRYDLWEGDDFPWEHDAQEREPGGDSDDSGVPMGF